MYYINYVNNSVEKNTENRPNATLIFLLKIQSGKLHCKFILPNINARKTHID